MLKRIMAEKLNMWQFFHEHSKGMGFGIFMFGMLILFTLFAAMASRPDAQMNACVKRPDHDWVVVKIDDHLEHECVVHGVDSTP